MSKQSSDDVTYQHATELDPGAISYAQESGLLVENEDGELVVNPSTPLTVSEDSKPFSGNDWKPNPNRYANRDTVAEAERRANIRARTTISEKVTVRDRDFIPFKEGQKLKEQDKARVIELAKDIYAKRVAVLESWDAAKELVNKATEKELNEADVGSPLWDAAMKVRQPRPEMITKKKAIAVAKRKLTSEE
jgi:hypothetical protein